MEPEAEISAKAQIADLEARLARVEVAPHALQSGSQRSTRISSDSLPSPKRLDFLEKPTSALYPACCKTLARSPALVSYLFQSKRSEKRLFIDSSA